MLLEEFLETSVGHLLLAAARRVAAAAGRKSVLPTSLGDRRVQNLLLPGGKSVIYSTPGIAFCYGDSESP